MKLSPAKGYTHVRDLSIPANRLLHTRDLFNCDTVRLRNFDLAIPCNQLLPLILRSVCETLGYRKIQCILLILIVIFSNQVCAQVNNQEKFPIGKWVSLFNGVDTK